LCQQRSDIFACRALFLRLTSRSYAVVISLCLFMMAASASWTGHASRTKPSTQSSST